MPHLVVATNTPMHLSSLALIALKRLLLRHELLVVHRAIVLRPLVRWLGAAARNAALATPVGPAEAMRDSDGVAAFKGAGSAASMGPAHALRLGAVHAIGHLALHGPTVLPTLLGVLGTASASFYDTELASFLGLRIGFSLFGSVVGPLVGQDERQ